MKDYYKILGVSNNADYSAIKKAYRKLALKFHPDINKSPSAASKFIEIKEAYDTLIDKPSRLSYDIALNVFNANQSQTTVNNVDKKKEEDTNNYRWVFWVMWLAMGAARQYTHPNTTSYATQNLPTVRIPFYVNEKKPVYVNEKLPANSIFVKEYSELHISQDIPVNSFTAALSKNQVSGQ